MSDAEKLTENQPAELHIAGIPQYRGAVSAITAQGLMLSDATAVEADMASPEQTLKIGAHIDLVFNELFDEEGQQYAMPVEVADFLDGGIELKFADVASELTAEVQAKLRSGPAAEGGASTDPAQVLEQLQERSLRQLDRIIGDFIVATGERLFELSSRPQNASQQEDLYEAMDIFKAEGSAMQSVFLSQIEQFFGSPEKDSKAPDLDAEGSEAEDAQPTELNLVDLQDFEDSLSLNRMIRTGSDKYAVPLECLLLRYAELNGRDPLETQLPIHVAQICQAFRESLAKRGISHRVAPEIYGYFADQVIGTLDGLYASLNAYLREQGIRSELEAEIKKKGSIIKELLAAKQKKKKAKSRKKSPAPGKAQAEPIGDDAEADAAAAGGSAAGGAESGGAGGGSDNLADQLADAIKRQFNPDDLYRSVIDALNFRRENATGDEAPLPAPGSIGSGGGPAAGASALADALSALQGDKQVRSTLQGQETPSLRSYISENQSDIEQLEGTQGIEPESLNQLDLVDNLFTDIKTEVDVTPDLAPAVGDLQIPLAKLALLEPQFFADREHPARGVIDKVAQLSNSANYPNRALEGRVNNIIDHIVENYKDDSGVFKSALGELDELSGQQQRALERNVERVVKTQDGQQKLQKAHKAVDKILNSRVRPPQAPKPIVDLVENGWRDLLTLTYIKQGPHSKAWKDYVKTLDLLSLWLIEQRKGSVDEKMQVERALEAEPFVDMISQQISEALPTNVGHETVLNNLKEVLAGRAELELREVLPPPVDTTPEPEEIRKKVESLPRLRRWVKRVEELEQGTWLTFKGKDGTRQRMQLAWISEDGDRYIFVNDRGQKVADMTGIELARQLSRGVKPPGPTEELPLVDQTMYKTLEHVQKSLSFEKNHDSLTQLINKETFLNQLELGLQHAKKKHATHALLYVDIDKFALVNDVYDELTGDQVLVEFAKLLAQQHGKKVSSARIKGNDFGVLLLDRSMEQAIAHAEGIRTAIEASPVSIENDKVSFTVSIGVVSIQDHTSSVEELMEHAELAVRQAKEEGRNKVVRFEDDHKRAAAYRMEEAATVAQIEKTLESKNFVLQAQPIARSKPMEGVPDVEHYEVLLSIEDESGKLHSPSDFILSAERFGYMTQVDRWVVRQVFTWISQMMDEQKVVPNLSINLSGNSVTDDNFMEYLFEQISEYGVGTNKICFEITETGTISNMVKAIDFVNEFKNIGCKFSIDDFGTGLASHSYLRELPVDYVKIDGSFVASIHESAKDYAMTKSINDLAHFLGQETIAEFAESEAVIEKLREIGVDYIQGWGVGRPKPLTRLAEELELLEK